MSQQIQITGGAKVRNLEGVLTGTSGVVNALGINVPDGIPQLDGSGKILVSQLPNSVMEYKGTWNASTNTPTLADGTGNAGDVYVCNVAGTVNFGSGPIVFYVGDQVLYSGTIWQRASGSSGSVTSVAVTESGDALTITGSPITTSGTINIGFAGNSGQYVNGAGGLTTFPTDNITGSGASGQVTYFNGTNTITSESSFNYDASTNRLGVNTSVPNATIGANAATDSGYSLLLKNDNANYNSIGFATDSTYGNMITADRLGSAPSRNLTLYNYAGFMSLTESGNLGIGLLTPNTGIDIYNSTTSSLWLHNDATGLTSTDGVRLALFSTKSANLRNFDGAFSITAEGDFSIITLGAENFKVNSADGSIYQSKVANAMLKSVSGVITAAVAGTDYVAPSALSGYVPTSRTITINGTTQNLSTDISYSVGTITGSAADGRVPFGNGTNSISYDSGFVYDSTVNRLGVNTVSPNATIGANAPTDGIYSLLLKNSDTNYSGLGFGVNSVYGNTIETVRLGTAPSRNLTLYNYAGYISLTEAGNLGVGILTPNTGVDIYNSTQSQLWLHNNATGVGATDGVRLALFNNKNANLINFDGALSLTAEGDFQIITIGAENLRVNSANGYIGIGNPATVLAPLHVYNAENAASLLLQTDGSTSYSEIAVRNASSVATSYFRQYSASTTGTDFGLSRANLATFFSNYASNFAIGTQNGGALIFGTANEERMRIATDGNVAIGTSTTGTHKVTIVSASAAEHLHLISNAPSLTLGNALTATYFATFGMATASNNFITGAVAGDLCINTNSANSIYFGNSNTSTQRMRLTGDGDLGIGTGSPSTKLDVRGDISVAYSADNGLRFWNQERSNWSSISNTVTTTNANLVFRTASGVALTLENNRNATFATNISAQSATFSGQLHIPNNSTGTLGGLYFDYNANAASRTWQIVSDYDAYGDFQIRQSTTQTGSTYTKILGFSPTGAATFGSSVTANSMKIEANAAPAYLYFNNTAAPASNYIALGGSANDLYFKLNGGDRMIITSTGNVGIGTSSPDQKLTVNGTIANGFNWGVSGSTFNIIPDATGTNGVTLAASYWSDGYGPIKFETSGTERMRITATDGAPKFSVAGSSLRSLTDATPEISQSVNVHCLVLSQKTSAFSQDGFGAFGIAIDRAATSAYSFAGWYSSTTGDREFNFRGDGNGYADGSWNGGGADYAEYFEWADGNINNEDRRGYSVSLVNNKIKIAEQGENIIGVISSNPSIVGDAAWNKWSGKYLKDDFNSYILDEDGHRKLNPDYDEKAEYIPREQRPEWSVVGLMGKLRIRKGQATMPTWIKMRDISENVEEWLIK
jgi:hypothetical protein